jgi:hypothetical protein
MKGILKRAMAIILTGAVMSGFRDGAIGMKRRTGLVEPIQAL